MTKETLIFLQNLVNAQTIAVGAPDFQEVAHAVLKAQQELALAIAEASREGDES
jgi:hypothetical protein